MKARVYCATRRIYTCKISSTQQSVAASVSASLLRKDGPIVVGDFVELARDTSGQWRIERLHPRTSEIFRLSLREGRKKVSAANVDALVVVSCAGKPQFKRGILDRFLVRASQWGVRPLVVFNKMDAFCPGESPFDIVFERDRLAVPCFEISALEGAAYKRRFLDRGLKDLAKELKGSTPIFVGQSGVGKSTTIGVLGGSPERPKTGSLGRAGKGAHTTSRAEIIDCEDFFPIDSPGIRSFSLDDIPQEELITHWPDLRPIALRCQFSNCKHHQKAKGCAFGELDFGRRGQLVRSRLASYQAMLAEISHKPGWEKNW